MPNPAAPSDTIPGGDIPFSELFGSDPESSVTSNPTETQTTADPVAAKTEPQAQANPEPAKFRLETSTGTVYDSLEAASKGISEKDTLIKQLRDQVKAATGVDPLARKPAPEPEQISYLQDPQRFAKDLSEAANKGDASKYVQGLVKLFDEYIAPVKPLLQQYSRSNAQAQVAERVKEWNNFRSSSDYDNVLNANPSLKMAIEGAENNIGYANQLPELYQLAYSAHIASKMPDLLQAAQQQVGTRQPVQQVRQSPTAQTLTPGNPVTQASVQDLLRTKEGREEIRRQFEASGQQNTDWRNIRWQG